MLNAFSQPPVGFPHLIGKFANLTLRGTPQLAVFVAIFAELLRKTRGDTLNPVEPFLSGHGSMVSQTTRKFQNFFSSSTNAMSPFLR